MKKKILSGILATVTMLTLSIPVYADNTYVCGELNKSGSLDEYDYVRTHTYLGPIILSVDNMTYVYLRLGLRNMKQSGGPQFTDTFQWNAKGVKRWANILAGIKFAIQGRMKAASNLFTDTKWGGNLTY